MFTKNFLRLSTYSKYKNCLYLLIFLKCLVVYTEEGMCLRVGGFYVLTNCTIHFTICLILEGFDLYYIHIYIYICIYIYIIYIYVYVYIYIYTHIYIYITNLLHLEQVCLIMFNERYSFER